MAYSYQDWAQPDQQDPVASRDVRFGVNLTQGQVDTGKLGQIPSDLSYDPLRDQGGIMGSPDPLSFVTSLPYRGLGEVGKVVGQGISGISGMLDSIGPVHAYGQTVGQPIGDVGKTVLDWVGGPGRFVQDMAARLRIAADPNGLSEDVKRLRDSGVADERIVEYMRENNKSFFNDPTMNLGASLILDPLNLTPFVAGKVALLPGLAKIAGVGAGAAAGAAAGGIGVVGGAFAGAKLATKLSTNIPKLEIGLDLSKKFREIQATVAAGKELAPWMNKYKALAMVHKGLFDKVRGISGAVKAATAQKLAEAHQVAYGSDIYDVTEKLVPSFGEEAVATSLRRAGLAGQQATLSAVRDIKIGGQLESAKVSTELLVSDIKEVQRKFFEDNGIRATPDQIAKELVKKTEGTVSGKYGTSELYLEEEVRQVMDASGQSYSPTAGRIVNPDSALEVWKTQRSYRLSNAATERISSTTSWTDETLAMVQNHSDALTKKVSEGLIGTVTGSAADVGAATYVPRTEGMLDIARGLADDIARSQGENLGNASILPAATQGQLQSLVETMFEGATIKGDRLVGGRFFNADGVVVQSGTMQRKLAQRLAWMRHVQYGYAINRTGNIRRVTMIAAGFNAADDVKKTAIKKEISRLLGRQVSDTEVTGLSKGAENGVTRLTIVRNDSMLDTEVNRYLQAFEIANKADLNPSELIAIGIDETVATKLAAEMNLERRANMLANEAAKQFQDIRNSSSYAAGSIDANMVKSILNSALKNDATFATMSASELEQLKNIWVSGGGLASEIDDLIQTVGKSGYRIGVAPSDSLLRVPVKIATKVVNESGVGTYQDMIVHKTQPFVDITSDFVDGLPSMSGKPVSGFFGTSLRKMFSPVMQQQITSSARQRMITSLGAYFTPDEIVSFDTKINELASAERIGVRGLVSVTGNKSAIYNAMDQVLSERGVVGGLDGRLRQATASGMAKLDIDGSVLKAYAGEIGTSGVTQWITGQIKANGIPGIGSMGKLVAKMSENFYPTLKYAANPFFWLQEIIESPFFKDLRGIDTKGTLSKLKNAGLTPQDVEATLGVNGHAVATSLHEAAFGTMVARAGIPTTLATGLEEQSVLRVIQNLWRDRKSGNSVVDSIASYKEAQGDLMKVAEYAKRFASDTARTRPDEYLRLVETFGRDEMDIFAGYIAQRKRAIDLGWSDEVFNHQRPGGWGFAVHPSESALSRVRSEADSFLGYSTDAETVSFILQHRPADFTRMVKTNIIHEAQAGGYDVQRLQSLTSSVEDAARKLKYDATGVNAAEIPNLKSYGELKKAVSDLRDETITGLGDQLAQSTTNELILRRLYDKFAVAGASGENFDAVVQALSNGRKYGAKFNGLGSVVAEIFDRTLSQNPTFRGASEASKIKLIDSVIDGIASTELRADFVKRIGTTLHDSAIRMLEDHAGEELAFQSVKYGYQQTAKEMDNINYFKADRGWLERSLNHQFLALYPLSYMFGKVLPEAARFLFWKPFGAVAPGAGYAAYKKFVDYLGQNGFAKDFEGKATQRPDYMFLLAQLIPGTPDDITVGVPGWLRRGISTVSRKGYDQLTADSMAGELLSPFVDTGIGGAIKTGVKSMQEITAGLSSIGKDQSVTQDITTLR